MCCQRLRQMASPTICFRIPCRPSRLPTDCRCPVQATWPGQPARRMLSVLTAQYDESVYGIFDRDVCYAESKCAQYENSLGQQASSPAARPARSGAAITIAYSTGWSEAYIHYQRGDGCTFQSTILFCQHASDPVGVVPVSTCMKHCGFVFVSSTLVGCASCCTDMSQRSSTAQTGFQLDHASNSSSTALPFSFVPSGWSVPTYLSVSAVFVHSPGSIALFVPNDRCQLPFLNALFSRSAV